MIEREELQETQVNDSWKLCVWLVFFVLWFDDAESLREERGGVSRNRRGDQPAVAMV